MTKKKHDTQNTSCGCGIGGTVQRFGRWEDTAVRSLR